MNAIETYGRFQQTRHLQVRCQQRCVRNDEYQIVLRYGVYTPAYGGRKMVYCTRGTLEELANDFPKNIIERLNGLVLIVDGSVVVTAYRESPTRQKNTRGEHVLH